MESRHYSSNDPQFLQALYLTVKDALLVYPEEAHAIERGVKLILAEKVHGHDDGTWTVESQTVIGKHYRVNGTCQCLAAQHGNMHCSHRWGKSLLKRALHPYSVERRDAEAVEGHLAALVTSPEWRAARENRFGVLQALYR